MEKMKIWQTVLFSAAAVAASWLFLWLAGPVLLPFAAGFLIARLAEPLVNTLDRRLPLPRWTAVGLCVSGLYALLALGLYLLCKTVCREAAGFLRTLPALAQDLAGPMARLEQRLLQLAGRFPDGIGAALEQGVTDLFQSGAGLGARLYQLAFDLASKLLIKLPDLALFLLTAVLSSFMLTAQLPKLRNLWRAKAPSPWQHRLEGLGVRLKQTLGAWFRAQLKLMSVTFLILTAGFLILGVDYPLLFGLGLAVIDALPVFGTGMILIPWGLLMFLQRNTFMGVGLLCLYGASALVRTALEPQLLGKQMGLDPLLTLLALYAGYHYLGFTGMILFPIGALLLKQFWSYMEKRN